MALSSESRAILAQIQEHDNRVNFAWHLERQGFWLLRWSDWESTGNAENATKCLQRADYHRAHMMRLM
jgi:hypothetical protein